MKVGSIMKLEDLGNELDNNLGNVYKCILINGRWGIGKSYYINKYINNKKNIYRVSLFGITDINEFKSSIAYCFGLNLINKVYGLFKKVIPSLSIYGINISLPQLKNDLKRKIEKSIKKNDNVVLIIDDLERINNNINIVDVLGIVEELNDIEKLSIMVIANDDEISHEPDYEKFKEKVIERVYLIDEYTEEAIDNICSLIDDKIVVSSIKHQFINSNSVNLRTLIKTVKFLKQIIKNVNIKQLTENDISNLTKCTLSLMIGLNEYSNDFKDESNLPKKFKEMFFKNEVNKNELLALSIYIYNYYCSNDYQYCQIIESSFKIKKITEPEKDLFFCSKEELIDRAKKFKSNVMKKYNSDFDIKSLEQELSKLYHYLSIVGVEDYYTNKEVVHAIDIYVDKIDINNKDIYSFMKPNLNNYDENFYDKYHNIMISKICNKYIVSYINKIKDEVSKEIYSTNIDKLYGMLTNREISKCYDNKIINIMKKNNFFIPNLNGDITEEEWGFVHSICNSFFNETNDCLLKIFFQKYMKKLLKNGSELGKYRINSLINQYHLND